MLYGQTVWMIELWQQLWKYDFLTRYLQKSSQQDEITTLFKVLLLL